MNLDVGLVVAGVAGFLAAASYAAVWRKLETHDKTIGRLEVDTAEIKVSLRALARHLNGGHGECDR